MGKPAVKILLVEDHADTAAVVARMLRLMGHEVRAAMTCNEARRAAVDEAFDLLLCDIALPDGDGCDLMREFRQCYEMRGVAVTGYACAADEQRCRAAGFSGFLAKPFDLQQLSEVVAGEV